MNRYQANTQRPVYGMLGQSPQTFQIPACALVGR